MTNKREREINMDVDEIRSIVNDLRTLGNSENKRQREGKRRYAAFAERYPMLFEMACKDNFDMQRFEYMLNLRASIDNRQTTVEAASREVGQRMFDIYVKDKIPPKP